MAKKDSLRGPGRKLGTGTGTQSPAGYYFPDRGGKTKGKTASRGGKSSAR